MRKPSRYQQMLGKDIEAHKEPCRICLGQSVV
jgi:hypothetical protein